MSSTESTLIERRPTTHTLRSVLDGRGHRIARPAEHTHAIPYYGPGATLDVLAPTVPPGRVDAWIDIGSPVPT